MRPEESLGNRYRRGSAEHRCFLLCLDEEMAFEMHVTLEGDTINCGPIQATGISDESMTDEAREFIRSWAREEAVRVISS